MPSNYSFTENGIVYNFDDVFVPTESFRQFATLWIWGYNYYGQLGINSTIDRRTPVTTFAGGNNWKQISCGAFHNAAIKNDGTLWVWGGQINHLSEFSGQLGINNTRGRSTPVTTFAGGNNWKSVACGDYHTAAIKTDGTLWVWGSNYLGGLGINNTSNRSTPVTTFAGGNDWKQVSCSTHGTGAIKNDGSLWVWGFNVNPNAVGISGGLLGINNTFNRSTPVTTFAGGNNWKEVSMGGLVSAAIKTDGTLWIWGDNVNSGLAINSTIERVLTPVTTFAGGNDWRSISVNYSNSAIKTDGTLWVWGNNYYGQLAINSNIDKSTPVTTFAGGNNWKSVSSGSSNVAAIKTDGTLWVWGNNYSGNLGINNTLNRSTPVTTFLGGNNWKQVSALNSGGIVYDI